MSIKVAFRFLLSPTAILIFGGSAFAFDGSCTNCSSNNSSLTLSATAETAVTLTITTGSVGVTVTDSASPPQTSVKADHAHRRAPSGHHRVKAGGKTLCASRRQLTKPMIVRVTAGSPSWRL
jgi:hypothetical protein